MDAYQSMETSHGCLVRISIRIKPLPLPDSTPELSMGQCDGDHDVMLSAGKLAESSLKTAGADIV
jgi:hypothetical protein